MSDLVYEKKDRIAYITLNRPAALNAMTNRMKRRLGEIWFDFRDDPQVWLGRTQDWENCSRWRDDEIA